MVTVNIENIPTVLYFALENSIMRDANEYRMKLQLGKKVKEIVLKNNISTASLSKVKMDALEIF